MRRSFLLILGSPLCGRHSLLAAPRRNFTNLFDKLSETVSTAVSEKLSTSAVFAESRAVTERRRKVDKRRPLPQTLAERLHAQREVRQHLVPTSVTVDASKQYVTFTWPFEAQRRADVAMEAAEAKASGVVAHREKEPVVGRATSSPSAHSHRTRALAEYLRAYTPSTDGTFGSNMLVYGRRGITITDIVPMGSYALRFCFSDGHTGGIYSYEYLYDLTRSGNKYHRMRAYLSELREKRKSRDPPNRARSRRRSQSVPSTPNPTPPPKQTTPTSEENTYRAPAYPPKS